MNFFNQPTIPSYVQPVCYTSFFTIGRRSLQSLVNIAIVKTGLISERVPCADNSGKNLLGTWRLCLSSYPISSWSWKNLCLLFLTQSSLDHVMRVLNVPDAITR
jgi:hypothetical protein